MMEELDFFSHVLNTITPIMMVVLFLIVSFGWLLRIKLRISYAPPLAAKIMAAVTFFMFAYCYLAVEFQFMELDHRRAMLRLTMLLLIFHELVHHIYVLWLHKRVDGAKGEF